VQNGVLWQKRNDSGVGWIRKERKKCDGGELEWLRIETQKWVQHVEKVQRGQEPQKERRRKEQYTGTATNSEGTEQNFS